MDAREFVLILTLILLSLFSAGYAVLDAGRNVVMRATWYEGVATVQRVDLAPDERKLYLLDFQWKGEVHQAWTDRESGDPQPGDRVEVYIDEDDLGSVAMRGWFSDDLSGYLALTGLAGVTGLGAFWLVRRRWREPEEPHRILRPRGNPGPRHPAAGNRSQRRRAERRRQRDQRRSNERRR
ncbi:hypothetical protein AB0F81_24475 [Actinoplanes sp. NPDC024001]|uniref:hypothetical protein n=1 Tax=Actinoplanes sp. NPDC024001 TaxID=3154598 RepID=UPI0033C42B63